MTTSSATLTLGRRPVRVADRALVRDLLADLRPELLALDPQLRDQVVDLQLRAQEREYAVAYPRATHEILVVDDVDVGRVVLDETPTVVRVVDLCVARPHRGRGIGSTVLRQVLSAADRSGQAVRLSVWSDNTAARRLYESLGFVAEPADSTRGGYVAMTRSA